MSERNLLDQTHQISLRLLTELLSLANPIAYTRAIRIRKVVNRIVSNLKPLNAWQYQLAALLSQLGCIALPQHLHERVYFGDILSPRETRITASHPMIGAKLLENISQLGSVALMVKDQNKNFSSYTSRVDGNQAKEGWFGAQILKVAIDYDKLIQEGMTHQDTVSFMEGLNQIYNPQIVSNLGTENILTDDWDFKLIDNEEIELGMVLNQDIFTKANILLVPKDQVVDSTILEKIQQYAQGVGIVEPFRVLVRQVHTRKIE
jgi:response regulator RpfG family c-di-GMP phosphodiesterase